MSKFLCIAILSLVSPGTGSGQKPPEAPPPLPGGAAPKGGAPSAASALTPGVLPASATPEAREAWDSICRASLGPAAEQRAPVRAFELILDVRTRNGSGGSNELQAEFLYLEPGYVRVKTIQGSKEVGRGPDGDWLFDGARGEKVALSVGREFAEDRRQLDEWTAVARIFVSLTDPRSLRIAALDVLKAAPQGIPAPLAKRASELAWICVRSPDFRLVGVSSASSLFRASLGWDPKTGRVELALVEEDAPEGPLRASAKLVEMSEPQPSEGFLIPRKIFVYSTEEGKIPLSLAVPPGLDLWVKRSNLRAALQPDSFKLR